MLTLNTRNHLDSPQQLRELSALQHEQVRKSHIDTIEFHIILAYNVHA